MVAKLHHAPCDGMRSETHDGETHDGESGTLGPLSVRHTPVPPSKRQKEVLEFVRNYMRRNGVAPSRTEISEGLGFKHRSTADHHLMNLMKKQWLVVRPNQARYIKLLHEDLPVVRAGGVAREEHLLAEGRVIDRIAQAVAERFEPPADFFVEAHDQSMQSAGLIAGDLIAVHTFIRRELARSPVLYVAGNHEHYGRTAHEEVEEAWKWIASETPGLHFLNGAAIAIDGVRFYGCTWYSGLWGDTDPTPRAVIGHRVSDFQAPHNDGGSWTVRRHVDTHRRETQAMREHAGRVDVMVTHWPPTLDALHPMYANAGETEALVNRYFVNDEEALVREMGARYWISGHTHIPHEATVGKTVTVGNPTGYRNEERGTGFRPDLVIEVKGEPETSP